MSNPWKVRQLLLSVGLVAALLLQFGDCNADQSKSTNELKVFPARSTPSGTLLIHGTADLAAMGPVIEAFQREHPEVEIDYRLYETVPLYQDAISTSDDKPAADLLISSAMDLQVKLVESRCDAVALGSSISVAAPFVRRCLTGSTMAPFSHPAHRTGQADFPHPALGQNFTPSPTARRAQAGSGVRAQSARKDARVDRSRPCDAWFCA